MRTMAASRWDVIVLAPNIQFDVILTHSATRINNSNLLAEQKSSYYEHCVGGSGLYSL